jgi:hypothetical protein
MTGPHELERALAERRDRRVVVLVASETGDRIADGSTGVRMLAVCNGR